jgi:hypothetical protein
MDTPHTFVSLGYRCSTAGILKRLNLKNESYPFDWMVSRLPIVADCIDTDFAFFTNPKFYTEHHTHTTHYHKGTTPTPLKICDETIYRNEYYQTHPTLIDQIRIPNPLSVENGDTYANACVINHRNIYTKDTQEYYKRCVDRFQQLLISNPDKKRITGLYIHSTMTEPEYTEQKELLIQEFNTFQSNSLPPHWHAVFFIMVRTDHPYPITNYKHRVIETLTETEKTKIYVVYTNRDFIDAGEIFMQNDYIETEMMCNLIRTL